MGPFVFQFSKDTKDKTHKLLFCQFQHFFWCFWCWRCFLVFFSSSIFFCASPFIESTQKMIQKITNRLRVVSRAPCLDECFFYIFFLSILKGVKAYFINILQYVIFRSHFFTNIVQAYFKHTFPISFIHEIAFLPATRLRVWKILTYFRAPKMSNNAAHFRRSPLWLNY